MTKHGGRAVISTNWPKVVTDAEILPGEMAIFWFQENRYGLRLNVFTGIPVDDSFPSWV